MNTDNALHIKDVIVKYGDNVAVDNASVEIANGEFFTLLGPSGCGKTTLLRTIAGFIRQTAGSILIGSQHIDNLPAHARNIGMVFQNYAIFPHLTVRKNIEYGLRSRKIKGDELRDRVDEALAMVDLIDFADRMPGKLSGGQQQRVVIARAIVIRPRVLLMDEPLANLDAKLRVRLRTEIRDLQKRVGITTVYVTHDQEEASDISDRIAVMESGRIHQIDTPEAIYRDSATLFVARFVGDGTFLDARVEADGTTVTFDNGSVVPGSRSREPGPVTVAIRPEQLKPVGDGQTSVFTGQIVGVSTLGPVQYLDIEAGLGSRLRMITLHDRTAAGWTIGAEINLRISGDVLTFARAEDVDNRVVVGAAQ